MLLLSIKYTSNSETDIIEDICRCFWAHRDEVKFLQWRKQFFIFPTFNRSLVCLLLCWGIHQILLCITTKRTYLCHTLHLETFSLLSRATFWIVHAHFFSCAVPKCYFLVKNLTLPLLEKQLLADVLHNRCS